MISAWWLLLLVPCAIVCTWTLVLLIVGIVESVFDVKADNMRQFREGMRYAYNNPGLRETFLREYYERKNKK